MRKHMYRNRLDFIIIYWNKFCWSIKFHWVKILLVEHAWSLLFGQLPKGCWFEPCYGNFCPLFINIVLVHPAGLGHGLYWGLTCNGLMPNPEGVNDSRPLSTIETGDKHWSYACYVPRVSEKDITKLKNIVEFWSNVKLWSFIVICKFKKFPYYFW